MARPQDLLVDQDYLVIMDLLCQYHLVCQEDLQWSVFYDINIII